MITFKNKQGFLFVSVFIALSDIIFIWLNYQSSLGTLKRETDEWAKRAENHFSIILDNKATTMQQLATFVANDPQVRELFKLGRTAVLSEGGGQGKERAAQYRGQLLTLLSPSWQAMTQMYEKERSCRRQAPFRGTGQYRLYPPPLYQKNRGMCR